ncbi:MAG: DUF4252 domain-containing protein [Lewinellaceae bacterium]|nr:DUF4252 domain-containing protein [Lewinellaceae bacterium]
MQRQIIAGITCLFLLSSVALTAQSLSSRFYQEYKREEGVRNVKIPGWLLWVGGGLAYNSVKDERIREIIRLGKRVGTFRYLMDETGTQIPTQAYAALEQELLNNKFEDLILIRDGEEHVRVLIQERNGRLKQILLLLQGEDGVGMISMRSRIRIQDLNHLIGMFMEKSGLSDGPRRKGRRREPQA